MNDLQLYTIDENELKRYHQTYTEFFKKDPEYFPLYSTENTLKIWLHSDDNYKLYRMIENAKQKLLFPNKLSYDWKATSFEANQELLNNIYILFIKIGTQEPIAIGKLTRDTHKENFFRFKEEHFAKITELLIFPECVGDEYFKINQEIMRCFYSIIEAEKDHVTQKLSGCWIRAQGYPSIVVDGPDKLIPTDDIFKDKVRISDLMLYRKLKDQNNEPRINRLYADDKFDNIKLYTLKPYDIPVISDELMPVLLQADTELMKGWVNIRDFKGIKQPTKDDLERIKRLCIYNLYCAAMNNTENFLIVTDDDKKKIIGFMRYDERISYPSYLRTLFLLPEYRGKGIGSWLLKHLIRDLTDNAHTLPYLTLWEYKYDQKVLDFYIKNGFRIYGADILMRYKKFPQLAL